MEDYYLYVMIAISGLLFNFFFKKTEKNESEGATLTTKEIEELKEAAMHKEASFEELDPVQPELKDSFIAPKKYTHYREEEKEKIISNKKEVLSSASSAHKAYFTSIDEIRKAIIYTEIINKKY